MQMTDKRFLVMRAQFTGAVLVCDAAEHVRNVLLEAGALRVHEEGLIEETGEYYFVTEFANGEQARDVLAALRGQHTWGGENYCP